MSTNFSLQYDTDYRSRIAQTRAGVPVREAVEIMDSWQIPVARFAAILGASERKWSRLRSGDADTLLGSVETDRLLRVQNVLEHASAVFDTDADAIAWLALPNRALSGETPLSLLDTDAGVHQVDDVLTRLEFGVVA